MMFCDVDSAVTVPVNQYPLIDDTDFKTRETGIVYNQAGMDLMWNFMTTAGVITQTAVTPTTAGDYDWTHSGDAMYKIEIPASGGASINNAAEGTGWFTGICTGVLAWKGPEVIFRAAGLNALLIDDAYSATRGLTGTALPAAAADAAGGVPVSDAGGLDLDAKIGAMTYTVANQLDANALAGTVDLNADQSGVTIGTVNNVTGLVAGSGGISVAAESFTVVTGTEVGGSTFADTRTENGVYHIFDPSGGTTDGYYQFDITNSGVPQSITLIHYAQSNGDTYEYYAYNWSTTTFEQVKTIAASNGTTDITTTPELLTDHVGSGANAGKVRLQVYSTTGTRHAVDRAYCTYTVATSGIPNGSTITLAATTTNENFVGNAWNLVLGTQLVSGSYVSGAISISGTATIANGNPFIIVGSVFGTGTVTLDAYAILSRATLPDTLVLTSTSGVTDDYFRILNSFSGVAGSGASVIDASGVTKTTYIANRSYSGGCTYSINSDGVLSHDVVVGGSVTLTNAGGTAEIRGKIKAFTLTSSGAATTNLTCEPGTPIVVNGTGGTLNIYGEHAGYTDNSSGAVTINNLGDDITDKTGRALTLAERTAIVDEWETQSQADPSGFHVNMMQVDSSSAGATRLKLFSEYGGYADGFVYIDTVDGAAGADDYENGTEDNHSSNLADALTVAASLTLKKFKLSPDSSITFIESHVGEIWEGKGSTIVVGGGGQDLSKSHITHCNDISGIITTPTGECHIAESHIGTLTIGESHFTDCPVSGTITLSAAGDYIFNGCHEEVANSPVVIDCDAGVGAQNLSIRGHSGSLTINNLAAGDSVCVDGLMSALILNGADATVNISGIVRDYNNNLTGSPVVSDGGVKNGDIAELTTQGDTNETKIDAVPTAVENRQEMDSNSTQLAAIAADGPNIFTKNVAFNNFNFLMVDDTDHVTAEIGLTVAGTISQDGGAFGALTNAVTEIGVGMYKVNITQAEMNADSIIFRFTATGADDRFISIVTQPT